MLSTDRKPALIDVHKCILIRAIPKDWNTETGIWNLESGINDIENYERKNSLQQCLINNKGTVILLLLGTGHCLCGVGGGGRGGEIMGWARPIFFYRKGVGQREFHDGWGWDIVCFIENHTHGFNSCGRFK